MQNITARLPVEIPAYLSLYIAFASEETFLFKLLFVTDMDLDMKDANDFYTEIGNEQKAETSLK